MFVVETDHKTKDEGEWGLEWTVVREGCSGNDEEVEEKTERGETDCDAGDNLVYEEEVVGEGITKEEESTLEHEGQAFHNEVEVPGVHSVHLALSIPTAVNDRSTLLHLRIAVEPLFTQHRDERGEKGSGQTCVKDGLDTDDIGVRAAPLTEGCNGTSLGMRGVGVVGYNLEEAVAQLRVIRLKIGLNCDDESGCDGGEQTSLFLRRTDQRNNRGEWGKNAHED